uniref:Uncharacterized protein n=1 Tax=Amphimedon queenslandica TaxID=400682 RepID=A0A1X7VSV3_AMPQE
GPIVSFKSFKLLTENHFEIIQIKIDAYIVQDHVGRIPSQVASGFAVEADLLLVLFCKKFEELYGSTFCTINSHLHCRLKECVQDFGPAYTFWLFSFERLNGIL